MIPVEWCVTRYYQIMRTLLKLGLSGYGVKPRFGAFQCEYRLQNPLLFREKILVTLNTHTKKMNPPSIILGVVYGKACWLIAYKSCVSCLSRIHVSNILHNKLLRAIAQ